MIGPVFFYTYGERTVSMMPYQYVAQNPYYPQMYPQVQPAQTPVSQNPGLLGRMVTSKEEALGVPVDFSGAPMIFPDVSHGVIYVKQFNPGTGAADIREYRISETHVPETPAYATAADLEALRDEFRKELEGLKPKRGVKTDE